jgi:bifunctional DNA-binding transcriptional regulator/antitoxin component of YhaV-PrlF toxin-antitoxin module
MRQKVIKAGNSTAVTVPSKFVKRIGVKIGDTVEVKTDLEKGQVKYIFSGIRQLALKGSLLKQSKSSNA